jgi:predicted KAP-like P-loop ATPase
VFYGIRDNKDLFTDLLDNVYVLDEEKILKDRARCDEILHRSDTISYDVLLRLLLNLFPRLHLIYHPKELYYHSETLARNNRRICSPDMFEVYFRLAIPTGYLPESEIDTILTFANDAETFDQALSRLNQDIRITRFLDLLDGTALKKIPHKNIANVVTALLDNGDLFPEGENNPLSFSSLMRIHRICQQVLKSYPRTEDRYAVLRDAIKKATKSIYSIIHELNVQSGEHLENTDTYLPLEHRILTPDQLDKLREDAVRKIQYWARIGRLGEHPKLMLILDAWRDWGDVVASQEFVETLIQDNKGLLAFLGAALKTPIDQVATKLQKNADWKNNLEDIKAFVPLEKVEEHAKVLFEGDDFEILTEKEQLSVLIFLDLVNAKTLKVIPNTTV